LPRPSPRTIDADVTFDADVTLFVSRAPPGGRNAMTTPMAPAPAAVQKWIARAGYLRWADALCAWVGLALLATLLLPEAPVTAALTLASVALAAGAMLRGIRTRWRPVSGYVGLRISRALRPGDRAWYIRADHADVVVVTARRGSRLTISAPDPDASESITVRRTRVLLVPTDPGAL
jgi:hypothetical protein